MLKYFPRFFLYLNLLTISLVTPVFAADESSLALSQTEEAVILTPKPGPAPRINGPKVYGAHPEHPFLYRIPAQGERPMVFSAKHLPPGLQLDATSGIITGFTPRAGDYIVVLHAKNSHGEDNRTFKIISGDTLSLTPSMGWNDWYAHYRSITAEKVCQAADILISSGMADVGYQYVNIDDCWPNSNNPKNPDRIGPFRDEQGNILPNKYFPDMKALTDFIHAKGLKAGIYTSPGPTTCAGFAGSYQHEAQDARQFAAWGFDLLKYDWCSYSHEVSKPPSLEEMQRPYRLMGSLLKQQDRDILFNLCQYGMGSVWEWGAEVGGQSWRTAGDLGNHLNHIFDVARLNAQHGSKERPGAWNDPDYIQIGWTGNAQGHPQKRFPLTPTEQYSFMSLWCLMSAPLFYSGDLTKLDAFTLNVLCNPEVIDIDQDPLGQCAKVIPGDGQTFLMLKNLENGEHALGLCNPGDEPVTMTADWSALGLKGKQRVRDVWREKDLGIFGKAFSVRVPRHGVFLVKLTKAHGIGNLF